MTLSHAPSGESSIGSNRRRRTSKSPCARRANLSARTESLGESDGGDASIAERSSVGCTFATLCMSDGIVAATMSADKVSGIESYHPRAVNNVFPLYFLRGGRRHAVRDAIIALRRGVGPLANALDSAVFQAAVVQNTGAANNQILQIAN